MSTIITTSNKYRLNKFNLPRILKVGTWTVLAGGLTSLITFIPEIEFPLAYAFIPSVINILLYSVLEFVKEQTVTN